MRNGKRTKTKRETCLSGASRLDMPAAGLNLISIKVQMSGLIVSGTLSISLSLCGCVSTPCLSNLLESFNELILKTTSCMDYLLT